jgi:hypothetical protein
MLSPINNLKNEIIPQKTQETLPYFDFVPDGAFPVEENEGQLPYFDFVPEGAIPLDNAEEKEQQPPELSTIDRLLQLGRGAAMSYAALSDLGNRYIEAPTANLQGKVLETVGKGAGYISPEAGDYLKGKAQSYYQDAERLGKSDSQQDVGKKFNEFAGKDITPRDALGRFLDVTGGLGTPLPIGLGPVVKAAKTGVNEGAKALARNVGKQFTLGAGGAAALEGTREHRLFDDSPVLKELEEFAITVFGMALGDKGLSLAKQKILGDTSKKFTDFMGAAADPELKGVSKTEKVMGKILATGSAPESELIAAAKKEGINLPFHLLLNGSTHKFIANNILQSYFTSEIYRNIVRNADQEMIDSVVKKINAIGPEDIGKSAASEQAKGFLKEQKTLISKESSELYNIADSYAKPSDLVSSKPILEAFNEVREIALKTPVPSKEINFVLQKLLPLGKKWGFLPPNINELESSPELMKKIIEGLQKDAKDIPLEQVIAQRSSFLNDIRDAEPGFKQILSRLTNAMEKSIETSTNKEYVTHWRAAQDFFKENVANRIRTDMARSLMEGQFPKEAFDYMTSAPHIKELERIFGESEKAKEVLNALKRSKLQQVIVDTVIDRGGTIQYGALSNLLNKKSTSQEMLKALLGEEQYRGMQRLAKISQGFVKSGKEFGNPSKTSFSLKDLSSIEKLGAEAYRFMISVFSPVGAGYVAGGIPGVVGSVASINVLSRILANPKVVNTALEYGKAAQKAEYKNARTLSARLGRFVENDVKYTRSALEVYRNSENEAD